MSKITIFAEGMDEVEVFYGETWQDCLDEVFASGIMIYVEDCEEEEVEQ